jgi:hypothetical protein
VRVFAFSRRSIFFELRNKQTNRNCHRVSTSAVGKGLGSAHIRSMPSWGAVASIALIALVATETHAQGEVKGGKTIEKAQACKETGADGQCGTGNFLREEKACLECYGWMTGLWAGWESEKGCGKVKKTRTRIVSLRDQIGSPPHHRPFVIAPRNRYERACWPAGHLRKFGRQPRRTSLGSRLVRACLCGYLRVWVHGVCHRGLHVCARTGLASVRALPAA